ncbi:MAG: TlpA family protein disulfide reductase [Prevotella sp.]|jgi:thiol-disulfide isomerase/thioredoxin
MNKRFSILISLFLLTVSCAWGQMLSGSIADTLLSRRAYLVYNPERGGSRFDGISTRLECDSLGRFTFSADKLTSMPFCPAYLYLGDDTMWGMLLQPGRNLKVTATRKNGKTWVDYDGDNQAAASLMRDYIRLYDYETFFPFEDEPDTLTTEQKQKMLSEGHARLTKQLKKVKDKELRDFLSKLNDDALLNFSMRLTTSKKPEYKQMLAKITTNDWRSLYNYLPQRVVDNAVPEWTDSLWGHDTSLYGVEYIKAMKKLITDADVKHALLDQCAKATLNYGKNFKDIDVFWKPFCAYADSSLIRKYQDKVSAIKKTKQGMMATNFSFYDLEGKLHQLSDFRGKTLYIDCWATWCGPCCAEIPHLAERVKEFAGNDKVQFISISLDENINAWKNKLAKDKPSWLQFRVDKDQNAVLSKAYGINAIPRFMVINADGTIADADAFRPSDKDFAQQLNKIINMNK